MSRRATRAEACATTLVGPLYVRLLLTGEPIDDKFIDNIINVVLDGANIPTKGFEL